LLMVVGVSGFTRLTSIFFSFIFFIILTTLYFFIENFASFCFLDLLSTRPIQALWRRLWLLKVKTC
jgi:hypothetical protein